MVLREACRVAASWKTPLQIAVNVSAVQFRRNNLQQLVDVVLRESGIAPTRLEFRNYRGVLIEKIARATLMLKGLKMLGVSIAVDDFGTGYSSLPYLQTCPLDRIKLDRYFIARLGQTDRSLGDRSGRHWLCARVGTTGPGGGSRENANSQT